MHFLFQGVVHALHIVTFLIQCYVKSVGASNIILYHSSVISAIYISIFASALSSQNLSCIYSAPKDIPNYSFH
jgi:hypothetical protein